MTYSTKIEKKVNWEKARNAAYKVHKGHNITNFPLDLLGIIRQYKNLKAISYTEFARKRGISVDDVPLFTSSIDGCILYKEKKNQYVIVYNDTVRPIERIYWTLAHEFGHYYLGHLEESDRANISRSELTDEEYDRFEMEADFFARFLINPPSLIQEWGPINTSRVMELFQVSFKAARNTIAYLNKISQNGWMVKLPHEMKKQFSPFIQKVKHGHSCKRCGSFFVQKSSNFCITCGSPQLLNYYKGDEDEMKYIGVSVNSNGKAHYCPRCENEEIYNGDHCIVCGVVVVNRCTNIDYDINGYVIGQCLESLPGNARFCYECGYESTFAANNLLPHWSVENERNKALQSAPF